jgi:uncharacterized FlgJ-related protein
MKRICVIFLLLHIAISAQEATLKQKPFVFKEESKLQVIENQEFNPENLVNYIIEKQIKHPHIVYAQALIETGWFTSKIFKENNNLFGMKQPSKRVTTALGTRYRHAYYSDWKQSVDDYLLWQQMFKKTPIETEKDYFKLLHSKYAEDKSYVNVLKIVIKRDTIKWI